MRGDKERAWLVCALALLVCALGWNNPFVLDDGSKIVTNPDIRSLGSLLSKLIYPYQGHIVLERNDPSRPLVFAIYGVLYAISGGAYPFLFHFFSSLVHALACFGVFKLLRSLLPEKPDLAFATAVLFAVNPFQTGSVLYAYALNDLLSAAGLLASLYFFWDSSQQRNLNWSRIAFVLALACKQSSIVAPALIVITCFFFSEAPLPWRRLRGHFVIAALYLMARALYFGSIGDVEGEGNTHATLPYLGSQGYLFWKYVGMSLWPRGLSIDHHIVPANVSQLQRFLGWSAFLLSSVLVYTSYRRHPRDPRMRCLAWAMLWFVVCWAPTGSFLPTVDLFNERRTYLANLGVYVALVLAIEALGRLLTSPSSARKIQLSIFAAVALLSMMQSLHRSRVWNTPEGIWKESLAIYPRSPRALNNLGTYYIEQARYLDAKQVLETLLSYYPNDAYAFGNLGSLYDKPEAPFHDLKRAEALFHKSLEIDPRYAESLYNLGRLKQMQGQVEEAKSYYDRALQLKPRHVGALNNLSVYWVNRGDFTKSREYLNQALEIDPNYAPAWTNMARLNRLSTPTSAPTNGEASIQEIPIDKVPSELILKTYRDHLKKNPNDAKALRAFENFCKSRHIDCKR